MLELGPCEVTDLEAAFLHACASGRLVRENWVDLMAQRRSGPCWAISTAEGATILVIGLHWQGEGWAAWFLPTSLLALNLLPAFGLVRLTLRALPYRGPIRAAVETEAGRAIAALCGLRRVSDPGVTMEVWEWAAR